jgi:lipoprotein-anchoring transpeptidase ErfK/SrfK
MRLGFARFLGSAVAALALAGCEMDPALMGTAPVTKPPVTAASLNDPAHYGPVVDSGLAVPAIPVAEVPAEFQRQLVAYESDQPVGTIIIDPSSKHLYLVTAPKKALRYGIAVGRAGFGWSDS